MKRRFQWASPTMVVACLALFVSLTGTSIAASHYLITSTHQIKPSVIAKLKGNKGPRGYNGSIGATGATGATGAQGVIGLPGIASIVEVQGADLVLSPGQYGGTPLATCPSGYVVVGTGWNGVMGDVGAFAKSYHTFVGGWFQNQYASIDLTVNVQAICAQLSSTSAGSLSSKGSDATNYAADVAAAERAAKLRQ
jgi:hypothetical protein